MHLAFPQKNFKPKGGGSSLWAKIQKKRKVISGIIFVFTIYYLLFRDTATSYFTLDTKKYPEVHGLYEHEIPTLRSLIFPPVEHAPLLKQIGTQFLFSSVSFGDKTKMTYDQSEKSVDEKSQNTEQAVRDAFKNSGRLVFDLKNRQSPEIVVVTDISFERYDVKHLTKVVQNRVDYAQARHYGVYIRWCEEFAPILTENNDDPSWSRLLTLRAAMHAFPKTKWFWYLNQDAVITRYDMDLYLLVLSPDKLASLLLKDHPIVPPNGAIHTYKNTKPENVKIIVTQNEREISTDSFIVANDLHGRALVEYLSDPLVRQYTNFPLKTSSALMHVLQWHPVFLSKSGIIPARTIASSHTSLEKKGDDAKYYYKKGDLAVVLTDCAIRKSCETEFDQYWSKLDHGDQA